MDVGADASGAGTVYILVRTRRYFFVFFRVGHVILKITVQLFDVSCCIIKYPFKACALIGPIPGKAKKILN
jgi:hypothetical protein